jgi:hypothetical protein
VTEGKQPGHDQGKEQRAKSPDRRARLAKALKANIARRKEGAQSPAAHPGPEVKTHAASEACDELPASCDCLPDARPGGATGR